MRAERLHKEARAIRIVGESSRELGFGMPTRMRKVLRRTNAI